jgi:hypothetical protein
VHVREKTEQRGVIRERASGLHAEIGTAPLRDEKSLERKLSQERRIAFEARAPISYNLKVVHQLGRFIGWLEQTTKANVDTASS